MRIANVRNQKCVNGVFKRQSRFALMAFGTNNTRYTCLIRDYANCTIYVINNDNLTKGSFASTTATCRKERSRAVRL